MCYIAVGNEGARLSLNFMKGAHIRLPFPWLKGISRWMALCCGHLSLLLPQIGDPAKRTSGKVVGVSKEFEI
jgi:hypothetical protein